MTDGPNETGPQDARSTLWVPSSSAARLVSCVLAKAETALGGEYAQMLDRMPCIAGFDHLQNIPSRGAMFFYLPGVGIGKDVHRAASRCKFPFFFRLFSEEQLSHGEAHSIRDIRNQVYEEFPPDEQCGGRAFLGWEGDPLSEIALLKWMCSVLQFVAEHSIHEKALQEQRALEEFARMASNRSNKLSSSNMSFGTTLALAGLGRSWTRRSDACRQVADAAVLRWGKLSEQRFSTAHEEYNRNIRRQNPEAREARWPLGGRYEGMLDRLDSLISELRSSHPIALRDLGVTLASQLASKPPTLAVVGAFSSGKTTLLNNVLLGELPGRAFRTRHTANTAIVYEIVSCGPDQAESVEFAFCDQVEHPLYDADGDGETWGKYRKMLLELLDVGILETPEICFETSSYVFHYKGSRVRAFLELQDQEEARRIAEKEHSREARVDASRSGSGEGFLERHRIRRAIFRASVTKDEQLLSEHLEHLGLSKVMNLASAEDWRRFQGADDDASGTPAEKDLVSILVKKAVVQLNSPLLRMTCIADTPGTGSARDRHDYISEQYIDHSEAFILLLRTGGDQYSKRVVKILKRIARKYSESGIKALPRVAFVINADHKTAAQMESIDEYLKLAAAEVGLTRDDFKRAAKIFAIDLKNTESCGTTLLNYPSLAALSHWISSEVFTLDAYKERLAKIRVILSERWEATIRNLEKRQHDGELSMADKKKQMAHLNRLVHEDISALQERVLEYVAEPREEMIEIRDRLLRTVDTYTKRSYEKDELNRVHDTVMSSLAAFNRVTSQATEVDPAEEWVAEISPHLVSVSLLLPGLRPPDRRKAHFESGLQANLERVERRFQKIHKKWPNFGRRVWDWLKSHFGGEDLRCHLAGKLQETLREEMDRVIGVFDQYHSLCSSFFQDASEQIETQKNERVQGLSDEVNDVVGAIKLELQAVRSFQKKRASLLKELSGFLQADAEDAQPKSTKYGRKESN